MKIAYNVKKSIKVITFIMLLSVLCACGEKKTNVVGTWEGDYKFESTASVSVDRKSFNPGDNCKLELELFDSNTYQGTRTDTVTGAVIANSGTWELKKDVVVLTSNGFAVGYKYGSTNGIETLTLQQDNVKMHPFEMKRK